MDVELIEIRDFLSAYHPFDLLPPEVLTALPVKMEVSYSKKGSTVVGCGDECAFLYVVRTGAVETYSPDGQLLAHLSEGEAFGIHALLNECVALNKVIALEDSLFYKLPYEEFESLRENYKQFAYFFAPIGASRLRDAHAHGNGDSVEQVNLMTIQAGDLVGRDPIIIGRNATVKEAAEKMREERVSCLLICEENKLQGIMTDRDLRNRVVAAGLDYSTAVEKIMTADPISLPTDSLAFDVLLTMSRGNIRHLPIMKEEEVVGVITNTNLVQRQTTSVVYLIGDIYKKTTYDSLAGTVKQIPNVLLNLVDSGVSANNIGHIITSISDATTIRLLQLAEEKFGPPPVPYLWLASGSQARHEQTGVSDQDNCLIINDDYDEKEHGTYFKELSKFVCDGLNVCGYIYCPGDMMAITDKWRQPLKVWKKYFTRWMLEPEPKALMLSSIFFDLRAIHGDMSLFDELHGMILEKAQANRIFIAMMIGNALTHTPPLGFFRNFVLIRGGDHDHQFDLKHNGVVPIVDIARIYSLEAGIAAVNTHDRLLAGQGAKVLSEAGAQDLLDSYEFISITRLKHQAEQIRQGIKPDNFMAPDDLSHFERNHLRDAFSVVKTIQAAMASSHQVNI
ncbi:MAG: DUF294 nucleotidyltransferase-like domain-containing protein [Alphaproteobacteria bacterium]|nr:DUF294 nucleotidyltransferase-like domain-containing protein [Rhodospirillales bacterium]MCW9045383.1 DUF294 nucleotidyltransferase-like domain-containing protein [Alphaproteobacteria bacterium]